MAAAASLISTGLGSTVDALGAGDNAKLQAQQNALTYSAAVSDATTRKSKAAAKKAWLLTKYNADKADILRQKSSLTANYTAQSEGITREKGQAFGQATAGAAANGLQMTGSVQDVRLDEQAQYTKKSDLLNLLYGNDKASLDSIYSVDGAGTESGTLFAGYQADTADAQMDMDQADTDLADAQKGLDMLNKATQDSADTQSILGDIFSGGFTRAIRTGSAGDWANAIASTLLGNPSMSGLSSAVFDIFHIR